MVGGSHVDEDPSPTPDTRRSSSTLSFGTTENDSSTSLTPETRATWASKIPYFLTLIGYTLGFGDIWRFTNILHSNGGVAFLVPYTIMLFIQGVPLFLAELAIGQRMRKGAVGVFNDISPYLGGIGLSTGMICYVVGFYWNTLSAWVVVYLLRSFNNDLPWKNCSTATNYNPDLLGECERIGQASKYYWYEQVLKISPSIEEPGEWNWTIAACLLFVWIVIWIVLLNGIKTAQVIVYVTATLPIVTFICILVANHFLEGSEYAYSILWKPDWSVLYDPSVWLVAATQTFFSLGLAFGSLIVFSSFMPARNDCYRDTVMVISVNVVISVIATLAIFPVLASQGYLRYKDCVENGTATCDLEYEVRNSGEGTGLLFIAFAAAANYMPWYPPFWSALFFLALYTIGINSTFGTIEGAVMAIVEMKIVDWPRWAFTSVVTGSLMVFSFSFAYGWGHYILDYVDTFTANWTLLLVALLEIISISWIYGLAKFSYDLKLMTGRTLGKFMLLCLRFVSPGVIIIVLISTIYEDLTSDGFLYNRYDYTTGNIESVPYPTHVVIIAFLIILCVLIFIPIQALLARLNRSPLSKLSGGPCDFPESELRLERNLTRLEDIEHLFDKWDRLIIGDSNMNKLRKYIIDQDLKKPP